MPNQIRITPEQMRKRANEYGEEARKVEDVIRKMDNLLIALGQEWEGDASKAYAARFQELRPGFVKAQELIEEISKALTSTANIVEQTDSDIANQFRS